ncbi:MAG: hypothetical protein E5V66_11310 [Mesorhizobium sp.]|nr:hypothetical protein EOA29_13605 [Mesorhizobium sp. M1E.F.Ca.ET.063.01.1.1]TIW11874.1 MAG: hypothetical protein E5V66_11310 [Mesorhizobium sp.]
MTAATPLARFSAVEGALASGFATAELHHVPGRDPAGRRRCSFRRTCPADLSNPTNIANPSNS